MHERVVRDEKIKWQVQYDDDVSKRNEKKNAKHAAADNGNEMPE